MGYLIIAVVGLGLVILIAVVAMRGSRPEGRIPSKQGALREEPSADEPTPARSATAGNTTATEAQKRTPPA